MSSCYNLLIQVVELYSLRILVQYVTIIFVVRNFIIGIFVHDAFKYLLVFLEKFNEKTYNNMILDS